MPSQNIQSEEEVPLQLLVFGILFGQELSTQHHQFEGCFLSLQKQTKLYYQ